MTQMTKALAAGVVAGLIGAGAWAAIAHLTGYEFGIAAVGVGLLVGVAMRLGVGRAGDSTAGAIAAAIAVAAILGGKFVASQTLLQTDQEITEDELVLPIAFSVGFEWTMQEQRELDWPEGKGPMGAKGKEDFPPSVWEEAKSRWDALDEEAKAQRVEEARKHREEGRRAADAPTTPMEAFKYSLQPRDGVWTVIAVVAAFGACAGGARGGGDDEEQPGAESSTGA